MEAISILQVPIFLIQVKGRRSILAILNGAMIELIEVALVGLKLCDEGVLYSGKGPTKTSSHRF
jgi:hypothetical protein